MQMSHDIIELICAPMAPPQTISTSSHLSKYNQKRNHLSTTSGPDPAAERYYSPQELEGKVVRNAKYWKRQIRSNTWHNQNSVNLGNHQGQWTSRRSSESGWHNANKWAEYSPWYKEALPRSLTQHSKCSQQSIWLDNVPPPYHAFPCHPSVSSAQAPSPRIMKSGPRAAARHGS